VLKYKNNIGNIKFMKGKQQDFACGMEYEK